MFRNYFKIAVRNLLRHKGYTTIKILGLSVGVMCCILIMLFVNSEWSYDKFHTKADRLFRVWQDEKYEDQRFVNSITPLIMAPTLEENIPEVEKSTRVVDLNPTITLNGQDFNDNVLMVDPSFFEMFDFNLMAGNTNNPLGQMSSIVLSESTAKKYFGNENALGKDIEIIIGEEKSIFTVTAIAEDVLEASSIKFNSLIPYKNVDKLYSKPAQNSWFNVFGETYVLLSEGVSVDAVTSKFPTMMVKALGEDYSPGAFMVYLQPLTKIHLDNTIPQGIQPISNPKYSYILATIGILILLVACANFIILAIGNSSSRSREVGVRKVLGAEKSQLIGQFMGEAVVITFISLLLGLFFSWIMLGEFNEIISRDLMIPFNLTFISFFILLGVVIAFVAGFYPAIILSKFNPVTILKGKNVKEGGSGIFRKGLIVGQFAISIALIICTLVIEQQIDLFKNMDLGYDKETVIVVPTNMNRKDGTVLAERYINELKSRPEISDASASLYSFAESPWVTLGFTNENNEYKSFQYNAVDPDFLKTMAIEFEEGRGFDKSITSDKLNAAIVNESFVKEFGLKDPVGKKLPGNFQHEIIGVVKDFHYQSLHTPISPLLLTATPDSVFRRSENINMAFSPQPRISVRMNSNDLKANVALLEDAWKKVAPNQDFEKIFLDETVASQYQAEQRTSTIVKIASSLSIFIAIIGLFGLVTLIVSKRRKEIGIRKVLGADIKNIIRLISMDFVKLISIAALISFPLAWWFMNDWLKDFEYRVGINWWVFAIAGIATMAIALLTVGLQSMKAAHSNPTNSLRTE
ncbi:putative ABC transport system permease protein [Flavobacteriaceae bacterium MAR_2010_188]|nr:putative ABC transport system permease protein [Flavobacteriaceae bacterium MAR_2010_188]